MNNYPKSAASIPIRNTPSLCVPEPCNTACRETDQNSIKGQTQLTDQRLEGLGNTLQELAKRLSPVLRYPSGVTTESPQDKAGESECQVTSELKSLNQRIDNLNSLVTDVMNSLNLN